MLNLESVLAELTTECYRFAVESIINSQPSLSDSALLNKIVVETADGKLLVRLPEYSRWIDTGRRPMARAIPFNVLYEWIVKKGINIPGVTQRDAAWMIQKSIRRKGIRARPFLTRLYADLERLLSIKLDAALTDQIANDLAAQWSI